MTRLASTWERYISEHNHILLSVGTDFHGPNLFSLYAAYQWTFGPTRLF